jgi:translation initiation factor 5B
LRLGTPLCIPSRGGIYIGKVASIQSNGKNIVKAQAGDSVGIKIVNDRYPNLTYGGRKFNATHCLYSELTRSSIEALEICFKEEMRPKDWKLLLELKFILNIL